MMNCKEVTRLYSKSLDHKISLIQKLQLLFHFRMCKLCSKYKTQLKFLKRITKYYHQYSKLSEKAKKKIKQAML